ncbi:MAG: aminopeptidase [Planctomycetes bacterium]|nr:aminopeptidase [Planctomycetota bacterium]
MDARITRLAQILLEHSTRVQRGERLLIEMFGHSPMPLLLELVTQATRRGALVHHHIYENAVLRRFLHEADERQIADQAVFPLARMKEMQAYIAIRSGDNAAELSDVPPAKMSAYQRLVHHPVHMEQRVKHTRWVVIRYPNAAMAQQANKPAEVFEDFFFRVCTMDYGRMAAAMTPLADRLQRADRVEIRGPGTSLTFSISGIPIVKCAGERNIPDGEVFTAPVRDSIEGTILFNAGSLYEGVVFSRVHLTFRRGRVVEADAPESAEKLQSVLDRDEGARYAGEFSFGLNPYILEPMKDTLFDEKIAGSIHMALGSCYDEASNGNRSAVHWDLVHVQRPEYGGGEIYLDGELVRKDGRFVHPDLEALNPERYTSTP